MTKKVVSIAVVMGLLCGVVPAFAQADQWFGGWAYATAAAAIAVTYSASVEATFYAAVAFLELQRQNNQCAACITASPTRNPGKCYGYEPVTCDSFCRKSSYPATGCSFDEFFLIQ